MSSAVRTYLGLLSNGPLSRVLLGEFLSSIGDGVYYTALAVLVYARTEDAGILGVFGAALVLPKFLLSVPAGYIADRFDRRLVLLASDVGCATCMMVLTYLVASGADITVIAMVTVVSASFGTFFSPAFGALVPSLVRNETEFGPANSAWATLDNAAWIVGPAVAGAILLLGSLELAFALNAVSYIVIGIVLWTMAPAPALAADSRGRPHPAPPAQLPAGPAMAGPTTPEPRPVARRRRLALPPSIDASAVAGILLLNVVSWATYDGVAILMVVLAVDVFRAGEAATGSLNLALGAGGAVGAVLSGVLVLRPRLVPALLASGVAASLGVLMLGIAPGLPLAMLAVGTMALGLVTLDVTMTTIYQRVVPDAYRGRFTGLLVTSSGFAESGGTLLVPMLVGALGIGLVLGAAGVLVLATVFVAIVLVGRAADVAPGEFDVILRRLARLPIFGGLPAAQVEAGLRRLEPVRVESGTVVVRQGEAADRFYVVAEGSFDVSVRVPSGEVHSVRRLGRDAVFGERGLLARGRRTATVTAAEPGLLFAMDGPTFLELVTRRTSVRERFLALYDRPDEPVARTATAGRAASGER